MLDQFERTDMDSCGLMMYGFMVTSKRRHLQQGRRKRGVRSNSVKKLLDFATVHMYNKIVCYYRY